MDNLVWSTWYSWLQPHSRVTGHLTVYVCLPWQLLRFLWPWTASYSQSLSLASHCLLENKGVHSIVVIVTPMYPIYYCFSLKWHHLSVGRYFTWGAETIAWGAVCIGLGHCRYVYSLRRYSKVWLMVQIGHPLMCVITIGLGFLKQRLKGDHSDNYHVLLMLHGCLATFMRCFSWTN